MKRTFVFDPANPRLTEVHSFAFDVIRQWGGKAVVTVADPQKSREQEQHYHALIGEIAATQTLYGKKRDAEVWKRILIDAFRHDTKGDPDYAEDWKQVGDIELVPALNHDGFVMMGIQSRAFTKRLAGAFITWLQAFAAESEAEESA